MSSTPRTRTPVMADVAAMAGVSHQTVSRVLNEDPRVLPRTRVAVLAAVVFAAADAVGLWALSRADPNTHVIFSDAGPVPGPDAVERIGQP